MNSFNICKSASITLNRGWPTVNCIHNVKPWMTHNKLKLNDDKIEGLIIILSAPRISNQVLSQLSCCRCIDSWRFSASSFVCVNLIRTDTNQLNKPLPFCSSHLLFRAWTDVTARLAVRAVTALPVVYGVTAVPVTAHFVATAFLAVGDFTAPFGVSLEPSIVQRPYYYLDHPLDNTLAAYVHS